MCHPFGSKGTKILTMRSNCLVNRLALRNTDELASFHVKLFYKNNRPIFFGFVDTLGSLVFIACSLKILQGYISQLNQKTDRYIAKKLLGLSICSVFIVEDGSRYSGFV